MKYGGDMEELICSIAGYVGWRNKTKCIRLKLALSDTPGEQMGKLSQRPKSSPAFQTH